VHRIFLEICKKCQIVRKKQAFDPAASNVEALGDSAVHVCPIHIDYEEEE